MKLCVTRGKNDTLRWRNRGALTAGPGFIFEGYAGIIALLNDDRMKTRV